MEKNPDTNPKQEYERRPGLTVHVVRHGPAKYEQEAWQDPHTADDLNAHMRESPLKNAEELREGKEAAVERVRKTAEEIAATINPEEEVVIWSSPFGRTLETARIIRDVFEEHGLALRERGAHSNEKIQVFDQFGDIRNFEYDQFVTLADGGTLTIDGETVVIDQKETNPEKLGYTEYYSSGAVHDIPEHVKATWPAKLRESIEGMERFEEISERVISKLKNVSQTSDKDYRLVIVSHGSAADQLIRTYKPDALTGLDPAEYVTVRRSGDKMVVSHAGALPEGNSETDVISHFEKKKQHGT